ncbi:chemotaxis protein CheW [Clostridium estertheticum]|uniref:chemotaxis protein CheW n=1 Tax=Clostridium estertheticum TaxID=238834 RepID=UPI001C7D1BF5|nr:chemotaxis protein CheW [Clostridium estertheticum]MBX4265117.1 chemotaxis protein CheW [Clostridium estertheticum]WLC88580.1 chemotaxis protein CheW [Clostridium estertheticum]
MSYCELVVFKLGFEEYAINISYAQEIIRIPKFTQLPNTPSFIEGVINIRGKIIPVLNLKKRFGIDSRLLIIELDDMMVGLIVDDVSEVIRIDEESIQKLSSEIVSISQNSIQGISIIDQRIIILLDVLNLKSEIFKYNLEKELIS